MASYTRRDKIEWSYDPFTGEKVGLGKHVFYVADDLVERHFRKIAAFDAFAVFVLFAIVAMALVHPSLSFGFDRMDAHSSQCPETSQTSYYRSTLAGDDAEFYDAVFDTVCSLRSGVDAPKGMSIEHAARISDMVTMDHPEFFWVSKRWFRGFDGNCGLVFEYVINDPNEIVQKAAKYDQMAYDAIYSFDPEYDPSDPERRAAMAAYLYDWVREQSSYVVDEVNGYDQTIMGVFEGNGCVCAGYARAYKFLCDKAGIPCWFVVGSTDTDRDSRHAWNVVKCGDGELRFVDSTWGDEMPRSLWYTNDEIMFGESHIAESFDVAAIAGI